MVIVKVEKLCDFVSLCSIRLLSLRLKQRFSMFLLFCKDRPEWLSEDALPQDANSFAESGRTDADTDVQSTDVLQKSVFRWFLLFSCLLCISCSKNLCIFVTLCSIKIVIVSVIVRVMFLFPFAKIQRARPRRVNAPKIFQK